MELKSMYEKLAGLYPGRIRLEEPLARYTTWRIGGPAEIFFQPQDAQECAAVLSLSQHYAVPVTFLGGGSNVLVADQGIRGLVIQTRTLKDICWLDDHRLRAGAGCSLPLLAREAGERGLSGLEFAAGIPGTLGGAVLMNAGAHGGNMAGVLESVRVVTPGGEIRDLEPEQLEFGYRTSSLKGSGNLIVEATLRLEPGDKEAIRRKMDEVLAFRRERQPLELPNAGSVFKNPPGDAAGRLIEAAGAKGRTVGRAQVSEKHANFIVNLGGATAADVLSLIKEVQELVRINFGLILETEVVLLGFDNNGR